MTVNVWQAGHLYPTGSVVQPVTAPPPTGATIVNPGFESGDTDWDKDAGWTIVNAPADAFQGSWVGRFFLNGTGKITADTPIAVAPGTSITCSLAVDQGASSSGNAGARVALVWYDAALVELSESLGTLIDSGSDGEFKTSTVTAAAPPSAAYVAPRAIAFANGTQPVFVDSFVWNYVSAGTGGLIFKAVQPATGASGATEPVWPQVVGVQVIDNDVIWEAMAGTRVVWEAHPILESGSVEPTWGLLPDSIVADGSIRWRAFPRVITDENCPHTKVVVICEGHVFAADDDIVRFSAALEPRDWTAEADAGFLNTGLSSIASAACTGLALYRKNLTAWTASGFQLYQMDPDPELMVGIDAMEGIGTIYQKTLVPIADDLFVLTRMGVRSLNISVSGQNMAAGDVGAPVDPLIRRAIEIAEANEVEPFATFYPALGQYMLAFEGQPVDAVTITGDLPDGYVGEVVDFQYDTAGGIGPKTVAMVSGALPPGLTMDTTGRITGTRTLSGFAEWEVQATDTEGLQSDEHPDDSTTALRVALVTELDWYLGSPVTLTLGTGDMAFDGSTDRVRVAPNGLHAVGSDRADTGADRFMLSKFDALTEQWVALAVPVDYPGAGPNAMAWSPSGRFCAIAFNAFPDPRNLIVYELVGDTLVALSDPAVFPANAGLALAWNHDETRLAVGLADTGKMLGAYDFDPDTGVLSNFRTGAGLALGNQGERVAFRGETNDVVVGGATAIAVFDIDPAVVKLAHWHDNLVDIPDGTAGVHWIDEDIIVTVGQNNGPAFVRFWVFTGAAITVLTNADDQPAGTPSDSDLEAGYLVIADGTTSPVVLDCTGDPPVGTLIPAPVASGSISSVAWGAIEGSEE